MATAKQVLAYLESQDADTMHAAMTAILSNHCRGHVDMYEIIKHCKNSMFWQEYDLQMLSCISHPMDTIDEFVEEYGIDELVKIYTDRIDSI